MIGAYSAGSTGSWTTVNNSNRASGPRASLAASAMTASLASDVSIAARIFFMGNHNLPRPKRHRATNNRHPRGFAQTKIHSD